MCEFFSENLVTVQSQDTVVQQIVVNTANVDMEDAGAAAASSGTFIFLY